MQESLRPPLPPLTPHLLQRERGLAGVLEAPRPPVHSECGGGLLLTIMSQNQVLVDWHLANFPSSSFSSIPSTHFPGSSQNQDQQRHLVSSGRKASMGQRAGRKGKAEAEGHSSLVFSLSRREPEHVSAPLEIGRLQWLLRTDRALPPASRINSAFGLSCGATL